ncbi:MAG TPA: hypothetical protein VNK23_11895 [Candidatus Dormibacteraeota bacterium]|nr:hypothetical protein [Candidatus Dormibacteraeota bacterium]
MDVLWTGLGIALIVVFVFFVLAQHWRQLLRQQSRAIRQLAERIHGIEDMADPQLRRRLGDAAPVPLEQVFNFSLRLSEEFWRETERVSEVDRRFIHEYGSFLASVKLERWRSHTVATVSEILPARKSASLQTRTLDFYPNAANGRRDPGGGPSEDVVDELLLWELALARPSAPGLRPPALELLLRDNALELRGPFFFGVAEVSGNRHFGSSQPDGAETLLRLPLDAKELSEYLRDDPGLAGDAACAGGNRSEKGAANSQRTNSTACWQAFYSGCDETLGIEWELRVRDLGKKAEWERWRIWESGAVRAGND